MGAGWLPTYPSLVDQRLGGRQLVERVLPDERGLRVAQPEERQQRVSVLLTLHDCVPRRREVFLEQRHFGLLQPDRPLVPFALLDALRDEPRWKSAPGSDS